MLLLSADFLATDYCTQVEIPEALRRHEAGEATVMPVILRSCGWKYTPLAKIQAYPEKAEPIKSWQDIDKAYTNVVDGVYLAATKIKERRGQQWTNQKKPATEQPANQTQPSPDALKGDYSQLESLLKAGKWKEADQETSKQMLQVVHQQYILFNKDIENFPCADLRTLDRMWVKYSQGKFGFSIQKTIWERCYSPTNYGEQWQNFGVQVGWRYPNRAYGWIGVRWKSHSSLTFDISAPEGHLPSDYVGGTLKYGAENKLPVLVRRLANCNIE